MKHSWRKRLIFSTIAVFVGLFTMIASSQLSSVNAAKASISVASPRSGGTVGIDFNVRGNFALNTNIKEVRFTICYLRNNKCYAYLYNTRGALSQNVKVFSASISGSKSRKSGSYSLAFTNSPSGSYKMYMYAVDTSNKRVATTTQYFKIDRSIDGGDPEPPTPPASSSKGYISIIWARTMWEATMAPNCTQTGGTRTLLQNAEDLQDRGLFGVGGVVVGRTPSSGISCFANYTTVPSWEEIAMLRDDYDWTFISQGMEYEDMTQMSSDTQRYNESVATLPILKSKGHTRAWGAFNYPKNKQDSASQAIVSKAFAFGRKYGTGENERSKVTAYPRIMNTHSVNGGRCNNPSLSCYNMQVVNDRRTSSVDKLSAVLSPAKNEWGVVQFYRLVEGKRGSIGDSFAWDCTSSDWRNRWSSQPELYCRESFLEILDNRTTTANIADPATVAEAWGVDL